MSEINKRKTTAIYSVEQLLSATKELTGYHREVGEAALLDNNKQEMTVEEYRGLISALLVKEVNNG